MSHEEINEPLFSIEGPLGYAECFLINGQYNVYFEPFAAEGEYVKPMLGGSYSTEALAMNAVREITGVNDFDGVDLERL